MGVKHTNTDVKFGKTIRLGKNTDLDNAAAGEVETGSLRDTGSHIERWSGTAWDIIGAAFSRKSIDFTDSPYQVLASDNFLKVDATGGNVVIDFIVLANAPVKPIYIRKDAGGANTLTLTPNLAAGDTIDGAATLVISADGNAEMVVPYTDEWSTH